MLLKGLQGTQYHLDPTPIGGGGEGDIHRIRGMVGMVVKVYKPGAFTRELSEKLMVMLSNPPSDAVLSQVAWPRDLVSSDDRTKWGFVMPELFINAELGEIYKYPSVLPLSYQHKVQLAQNICVVIAEVHKAGYVFGDFNPRNIGLDKNTGLVSFLDTDTYHVFDPASGSTYRCNVCAPGYAAPELLERCSDHVAMHPADSKEAYAKTPLPTFTQETDNFALAIHVFKLLMNGYTPFGGIIESASVSQSSPGVGDSAVRRDSYCYKPGYKHQSVAILPLETLPDEIGNLFTRAFINGKTDPGQRPNAAEWYEALGRFELTLTTCTKNPLHQYDRKNSACPLCVADTRFGAVTGQAVTAPTAIRASSIQAPPLQVPLTQKSSPGYTSINPQAQSSQGANTAPIDLIRASRQRIRKLSTLFSLLLWGCALIGYVVISYNLGYTTLGFEAANMSSAWIIFVFAGAIASGVELLFSERERDVLIKTIDLRELKSGSGVEVELREYKDKLNRKIKILIVIFVLLLIASLMVLTVPFG